MSKKNPCFVVQKHDASKLHYDFRLEIDGVFKSWVLPKGPSMKPKDKRLAIKVDDHDLNYASFEGLIPKGKYGAGTVMVWDNGTYKNIKSKDGKIVPIKDCLKNGVIEICLDGEKLKGNFALIKTKLSGKDDNNWLLIKMKDVFSSSTTNILTSKPKSVLTDRTLNQIKRDNKT